MTYIPDDVETVSRIARAAENVRRLRRFVDRKSLRSDARVTRSEHGETAQRLDGLTERRDGHAADRCSNGRQETSPAHPSRFYRR